MTILNNNFSAFFKVDWAEIKQALTQYRRDVEISGDSS
jgi:hypothetical protein